MNNSGDAAEQVVRMSLEGVEAAVRITGAAAKEIAIFLVAALKNNNKNLKLKGRARLTSMLKSGKPLEIISLRERDLNTFVSGAKQYGIVYCVLRNTKNTPDGLCDIMVKADDAPKISRLVERFHFATVDRAKIESDIVADMAGRTVDSGQVTVDSYKNNEINIRNDTELSTVNSQLSTDITPDISPEARELLDTNRLIDELMGTDTVRDATSRDDTDISGIAKRGGIDAGKVEHNSRISAGAEAARRRQRGNDTAIQHHQRGSNTALDRHSRDRGTDINTRHRGIERHIDRSAAMPPVNAMIDPAWAGMEPMNYPLSRRGPEQEKSNPSAPISGSRKNTEKHFMSKRSVKADLRNIAAARKQQEAGDPARDERTAAGRQANTPAASVHKQPQRNKKSRSKKSKAR